VFHEGDPGDSLHLVDSGMFAVQVSGPSGDSATINVLAPGDFFGELALIAGAHSHQRTATVMSLVPSSTLVLAGSAFAAMRRSHPSVDQLVVGALVQRVEQLSARLLEALHTGVDRRVYRRLLELAEVCSRASTDLVIPVSQDDLAGMAGASRPTVNQVLQKLATRGIISLQRRQITIEDLAALRAASPGYDG
jgi:CRP-like cAMP-binding protein